MAFLNRLKKGLQRSRETLNEILYFGGEVGEDFWEDLEDTLVLGDLGAEVAISVTDDLRDQAARKGLRSDQQLRRALAERIAAEFTPITVDPFDEDPSCVLFVGINGAGKTTTVGKLANAGRDAGRRVIIGCGDTFRAAALEQLDVWARRANVPIISRPRGADPASVCYDVLEEGALRASNLVLIDTAGRLHTSQDLMRELAKVVSVTRKKATMPVFVVLVIDATTGQNGLSQAKEFHSALELDGLIITKLDGTAKGGIACAISHTLGLPIFRIGVGESIEDFERFNALDFARALVGSDEKGR